MYFALKLVHVFGVVLFLGNITVGILWKRIADETKNPQIMAFAVDGIIKADRVFTIPGFLILLAAGIATAYAGGIPILSTGWVLWGLIAFILAGVAFGPFARIQRRLLAAAQRDDLEEYERLSNGWNVLGTIALVLPFIAFALMILKPALPAF